MELFIDSSDVDEIKKFYDIGIIKGVTTNPSLLAARRHDDDFFNIIKNICAISSDLDVSVQPVADDTDNLLAKAKEILDIADDITIKLPMTEAGLRACKRLSNKGVKVNMTLCFCVTQALAALGAGARYISPFIGRVDDISGSGVDLISDICRVFSAKNVTHTKVLAASIRSPNDVRLSALSGADIATISPKILHQMIKHPLTNAGIEKFNRDWSLR